MKVYFDICVVIDILGATEDLKDSYISYDVTCLKGWDACVPASTMETIVYVLGSCKLQTHAQARNAAGHIAQLFEVVDLSAADCVAAYTPADYQYDLVEM